MRHELEAYGGGLADKPEIVALNKIDALTPAEANRKRAALARAIGREVRLVSGVSGAGVRELTHEIGDLVRAQRGELMKAPKDDEDDAPSDSGWTP